MYVSLMRKGADYNKYTNKSYDVTWSGHMIYINWYNLTIFTNVFGKSPIFPFNSPSHHPSPASLFLTIITSPICVMITSKNCVVTISIYLSIYPSVHNEPMDEWMDEWMDEGWMDGWMKGWMKRWMDGWMNGWIDQ